MRGNNDPWLLDELAPLGLQSVAAAVETSQVRRPLGKPMLEKVEVPA